MISNLNGSGSVRVHLKKAVFTGSRFRFGFDSLDETHFKPIKNAFSFTLIVANTIKVEQKWATPGTHAELGTLARISGTRARPRKRVNGNAAEVSLINIRSFCSFL